VAVSSRCSTYYSFALQLAARYFKSKNIPITVQDNNWQFGAVVVQRLSRNSSGYQNLDDRGNQSLIRYRHTLDPQQIARQVTVREVLNSELKPDLVQGRVVLIGVTAPSIPDIHNTPYGRLRGLKVHAHMVSQMLSAVEDQRQFIRWLPVRGEAIWILSWSLTGGLILWKFQKRSHQGFALGSMSFVLYSCCWFAFVQGVWIPLVPAAIALFLTSGTLTIATPFILKKHREVQSNV
jgi:CHASE2 domain-containing sensor protein